MSRFDGEPEYMEEEYFLPDPPPFSLPEEEDEYYEEDNYGYEDDLFYDEVDDYYDGSIYDPQDGNYL